MSNSPVVITWKDTATCCTASSSYPDSPEVVITLTPVFYNGRPAIRGVVDYPGNKEPMKFTYGNEFSLNEVKEMTEGLYRSVLCR